MEKKTAEEIYEEMRPKYHHFGTLKGMCLEAMEAYAKQEGEQLKEQIKSLQSELSALREERTNHIHEIVRLNEELSKYDSHHP